MKEIETLSLKNIKNPILSHFHKFYVIGFVECGCRKMLCNSKEYLLKPGDTVVFNPYDVHSCQKFGDGLMKYFSINLEKTFMEEIFNNRMPNFQNVVKSKNLTLPFYEVLQDKKRLVKILKSLPHTFESPYEKQPTQGIQNVCRIIEQNLSNKITLEFLSETSGLSKSSLLRAFVKERGITPYKYIETLRISKAKELILKGVLPLETALALGFSSQSHFANSFKNLTGLSPCAFRKEVKSL